MPAFTWASPARFLAFAPPDAPRAASVLSPINQRRLRIFKSNRLGFASFWLFLILLVLSFFSEVLINDRPIIVSYKGELLFPVAVDYPESRFGGFLAQTSYRDPFILDEINANGWMLWPPVRYSYNTPDESLNATAPSKPSWLQSADERCGLYPAGAADPSCTLGNWHWLGTDDQGRDVLARLVYGFRISVVFGLLLTLFSSVIGVAVGAIEGYFGGWVDLIGQRLIDIWTSVPSLYLLLIVSSFIVPSFWVLLVILLLFSWTSLVGIVRAEFLRTRNFEYVAAARALGVSNWTIMLRHLLPNAMVATLTFMPFILAGSVTTLTSLDFLGLGLPPGSPSLGEMLQQAKTNIYAPWIGITVFIALSAILVMLVFIGEAVRDAFNPRKTFR